MHNPDSIGSFAPQSGATGFNSTDTIGNLPQLHNLPKDVLDLLKRGEVDEALALLALLQQSAEGESMVFWGKMGQNIMLAFTQPMQMILSMLQAAKKSKKIQQAAKPPPAGNHQASFSQFLKMNVMKAFKMMKGVTKKIAKVAFLVLKGVHWAGKRLTHVGHVAKHAAEYLGKTLGEKAEAFVKKLKEEIADAAALIGKVLHPVKEKVQHAVEKAIERSKEIAEQTATQAAQLAAQAVNVMVLPLVVPLFQFGLERLKGDKFSLKNVGKKVKNMGKWLAGKAKTAYSILAGAVSHAAAILLEKIKSLLEWLLEFLVKYVAKLWIKCVQILGLIFEIVKFSGLLFVRLFNYFLPKKANKIIEIVRFFK